MRPANQGERGMTQQRENFATQVQSDILNAVRALADLIEKRKNARARPHVMAEYLASHDKYSGLYKKLAE